MFESYQATPKDLQAIEEGIETIWRKEMDFIFKDRGLLENAVVISYDSKSLYLWTKIKLPKLRTLTRSLSNYHAYKAPHEVKLKDEWQLGWQAALPIKQFQNLLPKRLQQSDFQIPKVSGGLLTPFIELQKKKEVKDNPYITRESFLATIVHEFGHIYWDQHKLWWYSNKKDNIRYLKTARRLYKKKEKLPRVSLYFPATLGIGELFASCAEYWASKLLWPKHHQNYDLSARKRLKQLIKNEESKDLEHEDSVLEPSRNPHDFAFVFKKIILSHYPKTWPHILTQPAFLSPIHSHFSSEMLNQLKCLENW